MKSSTLTDFSDRGLSSDSFSLRNRSLLPCTDTLMISFKEENSNLYEGKFLQKVEKGTV